MIRGEGASDIGFLEIYIVEVDLNTGGWLSEFRQGDHVYVETAQESSNILYSPAAPGRRVCFLKNTLSNCSKRAYFINTIMILYLTFKILKNTVSVSYGRLAL